MAPMTRSRTRRGPHIGVQAKRLDKRKQSRYLLDGLPHLRNQGDQFRLARLQKLLQAMCCRGSVFIVVIECLYQCHLLRITMVYGQVFDLVVLVHQSNTAVIGKGWHNQLRDLVQGDLVVQGRD